jgi:hypothetical protein
MVLSGKKSSFLFCILLTLMFLSEQCKVQAYTPSASEISIAARRSPGADVYMLRSGHALYINHCGKCHELYKVTAYSELEWADVIPEMILKSHLDQKAEEQIKLYVLSAREKELMQPVPGNKK